MAKETRAVISFKASNQLPTFVKILVLQLIAAVILLGALEVLLFVERSHQSCIGDLKLCQWLEKND